MHIDKLKLLNFKAGSNINICPNGKSLTIKTCQRIMVIGVDENLGEYESVNGCTDYLTGAPAYQFLLETLCGLKSKILAEYEIVSQFKQDFQTFLNSPQKDSKIIRIMEKLFKDAKEVRTHFLLGICQLSYSGISRQLLLKHYRESNEMRPQVVITGTGKLAEDLIKILNKKFDIIVVGRNESRLSELKETFNISPKNISSINEHTNQPYIINTIGTDEIIFDHHFFTTWDSEHQDQKVFIDLGSPSSIRTNLKIHNNVYHLDDVFAETSKLTKDHFDKINNAFLHIKLLVNKRESISLISKSLVKSKTY